MGQTKLGEPVNMRKRLLIMLGIAIFIWGKLGISYFSYKKNDNNDNHQINLKTKEENRQNLYAIMLEQNDGSYKTTTSNLFNQSGYVFNSTKSTCVDMNGNKVVNAITYDNTLKKVEVTSNKSVYCYVYFDKLKNLRDFCGGKDIGDCSQTSDLSKVADMWKSGLEGDGYRYIGTNPANYICFGTTTKAECLGAPDSYMYRIIGVFGRNLKLIKKEALNTAVEWDENYSYDNNWIAASIYSVLNGSSYLTNSEYMTSAWSSIINETTWNTANTKEYSHNGLSYSYNTGKNVYLHEIKKGSGASNCKGALGNSVNCTIGEWFVPEGKIGLMYASDYALALGNSALNYTSNSNSTALKTSWMNIQNNDSGAPSKAEWTLARAGMDTGTNYVWSVGLNGSLSNSSAHDQYSVRPVFYLMSTIVLTSGDGTSSNPFIISW